MGLILALVFASGAATGAKLLTGKDIKDKSITTKDIKNNNLQGKDIKDGSVSTKDVKNNNLQGGDIQDGTVAGADLPGRHRHRRRPPGRHRRHRRPRQRLGHGEQDRPGRDRVPQLAVEHAVPRTRSGAAESNVQAGPGGCRPTGLRQPEAVHVWADRCGRLRSTPSSSRACNSTRSRTMKYSTYNPAATPEFRPNLRIEIDPHLVADDTVGRWHRVHHPDPRAGTRLDGVGDLRERPGRRRLVPHRDGG